MPGKVLLDIDGKVKLDENGKVMLSNDLDDCPGCCYPPVSDCDIFRYGGTDSAGCATGCGGSTPFGMTVAVTGVSFCGAGCYNYNPPPFFGNASDQVVANLSDVLGTLCYTRGKLYSACTGPGGSSPGGYAWSTDPGGNQCTWTGYWPVDLCGTLSPITVKHFNDWGCVPANILAGGAGTVRGYQNTLFTYYDDVANLMTVTLQIGTGGSVFDGVTFYPSDIFFGSAQFTPDDIFTRCYFSDLVIENELSVPCDPGTGEFGGGGQAEIDTCCLEGVPLAISRKRIRKGIPVSTPQRSVSGEKWGPILWREIHSRASSPYWTPGKSDLTFLRSVLHRLPCGPCSTHWLAVLKTVKWDFSSRRKYFEGTVQAHNLVNKGIKKPEVSVAEAAKIHGFSEPSRRRRRRS